MEDRLQDNVQAFWERLTRACDRCGRRKEEIAVVAATKCVPASVVERLPQYGIRTAGENRVQEFLQKYRDDSPLTWHIIGALQTNKVKYVVGKVAMIQSVDRVSLLDEIDRRSQQAGVVTDVLIEVNVGREENKSGVAAEGADELAAAAVERKGVRLRGLMSVPPVGADDKAYEKMYDLYCDVHAKYASADVLSMGMSNDFERAIRNGATMVRPGRILFGERTYGKT